ncbi:hypothetical protein SAY86_008334 [Trapa natans]|uniref:Protein BIG GRAIN 1-like A n=1 Tax=Trapa natans TaxID=22666 RepID=A0AAN7K9B5_TRANT|nr:hypothetical protein SAY86_008334 [Trapa natans]
MSLLMTETSLVLPRAMISSPIPPSNCDIKTSVVIMERKTVHHPKFSSSSSSALSNPSFSSSLLDSIYRSIDKDGCGEKIPEELAFYTGLTLTAKERRSWHREKDYGEEESADKSWLMMGKSRSTVKATASSTDGRKSLSAMLLSSNSNSFSSSSSDSIFWSGSLSSSESDSYCPKLKSSSSSFSCYSMKRSEAIRTERSSKLKSSSPSQENWKKPPHHDHEEKSPAKMKKSRAMKIYAELKKAKSKQPVSPGSRVASFLNSLFANTKKTPKMAMKPSGETGDEKISRKLEYTKSKSIPASFPSSASSFTRSCLSKTLPSHTRNLVSKRYVRFDPVSVIVDEDTQPCRSKINLGEEDELKKHVTAENRRVAEAGRRLLESYRRKKVSSGGGGGDLKVCDGDLSEDNENVNDSSSCSSSDLFELDNLFEKGVDRPYRDELPVYETTHINTKRAIASGLIL